MSLGNETQSRAIADQVAMAAVERYAQLHPTSPAKAEIPAPLKWAATIIASIMAAGTVGLCLWAASTLSSLQQTVTRIDERQQINGSNIGERLKTIEERLSRVEQNGRQS